VIWGGDKMISKKKFKIISIVTVLFVITTLISLNNINAKASNIASKPNFTITNLSATPNPAKVGEDILVSGKIVPEDFETTSQPKEIVLVLDTSGSMKYEIEDICTSERVRYCTSHGSSEPNHSNIEWSWGFPIPTSHKWVENYCVDHATTSKNHNSTRISELKKAAKSFIESMQGVPNLKIGIVAYSTEANINPIERIGTKYINVNMNGRSYNSSENNYRLLGSNFIPVSEETGLNNLNKIIDEISALGGTNTGEGLRKALYILNKGDQKANKTIVLMSDGLPTFASSNKSIDSLEYGSISGQGSGENDTASLNYAKEIGAIVKQKGYSAYSIGYGLNNNGVNNFKQIHASMKGLSSPNDANEQSGFFSKSDGSITEIFNQIAENIKNSYELKEVSLNIDLNQSFNLNIGGNEVKVGNIIYNKTSEDKITGKVRYHAEPVSFSFIVKGTQVGTSQSILDSIDINFLFENEKLTVNSNVDVKVDIISNELPNISAKLISENKLEIKKDEEITLKYEISPQDFVYNNSSNSGDIDVVVIVELGRKQGNLDSLKNGIKNKLTDPFQNEKKAKFSLITFNNNETKKEASLKSFENSTNYYHDIRLTIDNLKEGSIFESSTKDISESLNNAYEELERNSRPTATKNIVIISNNDINYNKQVANNIKSKGYNIVSLSLETESLDKNLYKLHSDLGGKSDSIFNINNDYNNINNSRMDLVREKIVSYAAAKPYEFKPVINLNIGSNFEPVSGIVRSTESGKQNIGIVEIPTIVYNLTQNNNYHAEGKILEIKLKANNLASGSYSFGRQADNIMIYKSILGNPITTNIVTPTVTVKQELKDLTHGLYNGIENNSINIQQGNDNSSFEMAQGSTVTFGSKFIVGGNSVELNLNIDSKFNTVNRNDIKIYTVSKDSSGNIKLIEISDINKKIDSLGGNNFKLSISNIKENGSNNDTEILVVYKARIKESSENQTLTNAIVTSSLSKDVKITTPSKSNERPNLPDLF
jgi:hypothetical protein